MSVPLALLQPNSTAISAILASATPYVAPSVASLFAAGVPLAQVDPSLILNGSNYLANVTAATIWPQTFSHLYYNVSYLFPYWETSGIMGNSSAIATYCHPQVCSLLLGQFLYLPSLAANAFFAAFFGLGIVATIGLGIRYRTWGFMGGIIFGLLCEVLGYIGRILIAKNDYSKNPFYIYIICLTIGPAFLSFSIYLCLARIVVVYGKNLSRFKPKTYTYIFAVCDLVSLVLQALGGALATTANTQVASDRGVHIMIAGLAFQVVSLTVFMVLCTDFAIRIRRHRAEIDPTYGTLRHSARFRGFLVALAVATVTIFIRSVFRVAELQQGFHSQFANDEVTFMVLEATMISIATIALTVYHPGLVFKEAWLDISAVIKGKRASHKAGSDYSDKYPVEVVAPNKMDHRGYPSS